MKFLLFSGIDELRGSCLQIYDKYNLLISFKAFMLKYQRYVRNNGKNNGCMIFNILEEEYLIAFLKGWSLLFRPPTRSMFLDHVCTMRPDVKDWNPLRWFQLFMKRHKSRLSLLSVQSLKYERIKYSLNDNVSEFENWLQK